jgi:hypothetical protein
MISQKAWASRESAEGPCGTADAFQHAEASESDPRQPEIVLAGLPGPDATIKTRVENIDLYDLISSTSRLRPLMNGQPREAEGAINNNLGGYNIVIGK